MKIHKLILNYIHKHIFFFSFSFNPSTSFFEHFQCIFKFGQRYSRCQRGCKSGTSKKIKNGLVKFSWVHQFETRIWLSVVIFWKRFVYYGIYLLYSLDLTNYLFTLHSGNCIWRNLNGWQRCHQSFGKNRNSNDHPLSRFDFKRRYYMN